MNFLKLQSIDNIRKYLEFLFTDNQLHYDKDEVLMQMHPPPTLYTRPLLTFVVLTLKRGTDPNPEPPAT